MRKTAGLSALTVLFLLPAAVQAQTILTFDIAGASDGNPVDQNYGDNVTSTTMGPYTYGTGGGGFTPNISVSYSGGTTGPQFWTTDYGDLTNVIYGEQSQLLLVTLTPQAGATVTLNSFDLGGWPDTDYTINAVQVFGDGGALLFNQSNVFVRGTGGPPAHTSFTFNNLTASNFLTIQIDALNLGSASDNIGIDNISFSQGVAVTAAPEPRTLALLAMGMLSVAFVPKRRRKA